MNMMAATQEPVSNTIPNVLQHQDLVRAIAHTIHRRLPSHVEVDDLVSTGMVGLLTAVARFDPARGVPFKAFARFYIQGAIMDSLRDADWVPRAVRRKAQRIDREVAGFYQKQGRRPSANEVATRLEVTTTEFDTLQRDAQIHRLTSLDMPLGEDGGATLGDHVPADQPDAEATAIDDERRAAVINAVKGLPERERIAVSLYYFRGLALKEIGTILGVSESRVCQLRSQGTARLKKRLRAINIV